MCDREVLCRAQAGWEQHHPLLASLCGAARVWASTSLRLPVLTPRGISTALKPVSHQQRQRCIWPKPPVILHREAHPLYAPKYVVSTRRGALASAHLIGLHKRRAREGCEDPQAQPDRLFQGIYTRVITLSRGCAADAHFYLDTFPPHKPT